MKIRKAAAAALVTLGLAGGAAAITVNQASATDPVTFYTVEHTELIDSSHNSSTASCTTGDRATGGGFDYSNAQVGHNLVPTANLLYDGNGVAYGYYAYAKFDDTNYRYLSVVVSCEHQ